MADFPGITHVALTVSDLDRSVHWYAGLVGAKPDKLHDSGAFRAAVWILGERNGRRPPSVQGSKD